MAGVLVVGGVEPDELKAALYSMFNRSDWFWSQRTRHVHIRMLLRKLKLGENVDKWIADRDFCVSLVEVLGLTPQQLLDVGSACDSILFESGPSFLLVGQGRFPCRYILSMGACSHWRLQGAAFRYR